MQHPAEAPSDTLEVLRGKASIKEADADEGKRDKGVGEPRTPEQEDGDAMDVVDQ